MLLLYRFVSWYIDECMLLVHKISNGIKEPNQPILQLEHKSDIDTR